MQDRLTERSFGVNVIPLDGVSYNMLERLLIKMFDVEKDLQAEHTYDFTLLRDDILSYDSDALASVRLNRNSAQ